ESIAACTAGTEAVKLGRELLSLALDIIRPDSHSAGAAANANSAPASAELLSGCDKATMPTPFRCGVQCGQTRFGV
ncbi:hypothetical protein C2U68_16370, partial [Methylomonas koyamae]